MLWSWPDDIEASWRSFTHPVCALLNAALGEPSVILRADYAALTCDLPKA
jgi:hypothetical protein